MAHYGSVSRKVGSWRVTVLEGQRSDIIRVTVHLPRWTAENHEKSHKSTSTDRDLNTAPAEFKVQAVY